MADLSKKKMNFNDLLKNINDYEIGDKISNGSFSVVFQAARKKTGKKVALNFFLRDPLQKHESSMQIIGRLF